MQRHVTIITTLFIVSVGGCGLNQPNGQQPSLPPTTPPASPTIPVDETGPPTTTSRPAVLGNVAPGTKINIRSQPNLQSKIVYQGEVGDRVHSQKQARDRDGKTWYYITFDAVKAQGWVHGNLIRFVSQPPPSPTAPAITVNTALERCRQQGQAEFPGTRIQVWQGWQDANGNFVVNWSASSGPSGTCTVDRNGWVTSFSNTNTGDRPTDDSIPQAALRACQQRGASVLGVAPAAIQTQPASFYADGTFGVKWWTQFDDSGFCRVNRNGDILSFVTDDRPSPEQVALNRCKQRAERELPGARIRVYLDDRERSSNYKVIWSASSGEDGYCRVDRNGNLTQFFNAANQGNQPQAILCSGTIFGDTSFTAAYRDRRFQQVDFRNLDTDYRFTAALEPAGSNAQGQPIYKGTNNDVPSDRVTVVDLSGGNPKPGSQISLAYNNNWVRGTCRQR